MSGVNKVILVGNLGADPETRNLPNGDSVTSLRLATSEKWNDKATGEKKERTEWHSVVLFRKLAEIAAQYLTKGSTVYLEGKLQTRKWTDKNGNDRYTTEIIADDMHFLNIKRDGNTAGGSANTTSQQPGGGAGKSRPDAARPAPAPQAAPDLGEEELDDDLPF